jgi:hypothetical protein
MGNTTRKMATVETLFSATSPAGTKEARGRLDTLLKTDQTVTMTISPAMAELMLEHNTGNRSLSAVGVKTFAAAMKAGDWRLTGQPIIFSKDGALNDGQHRLSAIVAAGVSIRSDVRFGVDRSAFLATDIGRKRTAGDGLSIAGEKNACVTAAAIRLASSFDARDYTFGGSLTPATALEYLEKHGDLREAATRASHFYQNFRLIPASVYAFAYWHCARIDRAAADVFFEKIATGIGIGRKTDPAGVIRNKFISAQTERMTWRPRSQIAVIFSGWNALRLGRRLTAADLTTSALSSDAFPIPR